MKISSLSNLEENQRDGVKFFILQLRILKLSTGKIKVSALLGLRVNSQWTHTCADIPFFRKGHVTCSSLLHLSIIQAKYFNSFMTEVQRLEKSATTMYTQV